MSVAPVGVGEVVGVLVLLLLAAAGTSGLDELLQPELSAMYRGPAVQHTAAGGTQGRRADG